MIKQYLLDYLSLPEKDLNHAVNIAPVTYKEFNIPKRNSNKTRRISQPSAVTKMLQYCLIDCFFSKIFIPNDYSFAYIKNRKSPLKKNAELHAGNSYAVHFDIKDFFPSITPYVLFSLKTISEMYLSDEDKEYISKICFLGGGNSKRLAIGAPSSPIISNIVMSEFDNNMIEFAKHNGFVYSRYADDLWLSSDKELNIQQINMLIENTFEKCRLPFLINQEKTRVYGEGMPRKIVGLSITKEGSVCVPRSTKRIVRSLMSKNNLSAKDIMRLNGYVSFIRDNEPGYLNNLVFKYGEKYSRYLVRKKEHLETV